MNASAPSIVILAGGVGGSRFTLGVRAAAHRRWGGAASITVIANTGDDAWVSGVRLQPDIDSLLYALAGVNDTERGWGRTGETERVQAELLAFGASWPWFTLGDLDAAMGIARAGWLREDVTVSEIVARLSARWDLGGVRILPMTDTAVETTVITDDGSMHFQEWWVRHRADVRPRRFEHGPIDTAAPAPGVLEAIAGADAVLLAPSNPVVSIGPILRVPGIAEAVATAPGRILGVSPIIGGRVVRGMADVCLDVLGVPTAADAVGRRYGPRGGHGAFDRAARPGLLDGWLIAEEDAALAPGLAADGIATRVRPLWMRDAELSAALGDAALDAALDAADF